MSDPYAKINEARKSGEIQRLREELVREKREKSELHEMRNLVRKVWNEAFHGAYSILPGNFDINEDFPLTVSNTPGYRRQKVSPPTSDRLREMRAKLDFVPASVYAKHIDDWADDTYGMSEVEKRKYAELHENPNFQYSVIRRVRQNIDNLAIGASARRFTAQDRPEEDDAPDVTTQDINETSLEPTQLIPTDDLTAYMSAGKGL